MQIDLESLSFAEWLIELNICAIRSGYPNNQPLTHITGQICWYPFYEEGLTPLIALKEATQDGIAFGAEYENG